MWVPWPAARLFRTIYYNIHVLILILILNHKVICCVTKIIICIIWTIRTWYHSKIVRCNRSTAIKRQKCFYMSYKHHLFFPHRVARFHLTICQKVHVLMLIMIYSKVRRLILDNDNPNPCSLMPVIPWSNGEQNLCWFP